MASRSVRTSEIFYQLLEIIIHEWCQTWPGVRVQDSGTTQLVKFNPKNLLHFAIKYVTLVSVSLECLTDTKSVDRRQSLMHFVVETISNQFPQLQAFVNHLQFIEKASQFSLENVLSDLHDLEKGIELTKKEACIFHSLSTMLLGADSLDLPTLRGGANSLQSALLGKGQSSKKKHTHSEHLLTSLLTFLRDRIQRQSETRWAQITLTHQMKQSDHGITLKISLTPPHILSIYVHFYHKYTHTQPIRFGQLEPQQLFVGGHS